MDSKTKELLKTKEALLNEDLQALYSKHTINQNMLKNKYVLSPDYSDALKEEQKNIKQKVEDVQQDIRLSKKMLGKYS